MASMSRRKFSLFMAWIAASYAFSVSPKIMELAGDDESPDALAPQLKLQTFSTDPATVVRSFDGASTGLLMAGYGNFYPGFMESRAYWKAPAELAEAVKDHDLATNPHRMVALPAAAAAHSLLHSDPKRHDELSTGSLRH